MQSAILDIQEQTSILQNMVNVKYTSIISSIA